MRRDQRIELAGCVWRVERDGHALVKSLLGSGRIAKERGERWNAAQPGCERLRDAPVWSLRALQEVAHWYIHGTGQDLDEYGVKQQVIESGPLLSRPWLRGHGLS
jgi:hypothetical protein